MKTIFGGLVLVFAFVTLPSTSFVQSAGAPRIFDVEFKDDLYLDSGHVQPHRPCPPTVPQGVCGNDNSKGYLLTGRRGDHISISLTSKTGGAVFSVFAPNGDLIAGGVGSNSWTGKLPVAGYYRINVFTNKAFTPFNIRFQRRR